MKAVGVSFVLCGVLILNGCSLGAAESIPEEPPELSDASEVPPEPEFVPEFVPDGGARENQPYLDWVIGQTLEQRSAGRSGLAVVEALEAAGLDRGVLEVTRDASLIELPVDSVSVAVRFEDECFLGQWGEDWYVSQIEPVLVTGKCLVGETVSLD